MNSSRPRNSLRKKRQAVSVIGATAVIAVLIVAVVYGLYTFRLSIASNVPSIGNLAPNAGSSSTTTVMTSPTDATTGSQENITVFGNATYGVGGGECSGAFFPTGVEFISSSGVNYTTKYHFIQQTAAPNPPYHANDTGNYSINLPNNDQYKVYIIVYFNCQIAQPPVQYTTNCSAGTFNLHTNPSNKIELNLDCGFAPSATTISTTSSSTVSTTETTTESTTSVNTNVSTTCQNP